MSARSIGIVVILSAVASAPLRGAGAGEQQSTPPTTAAAEVTTCAQAQMVADQLLAAAMLRVDAARQTNAAADLRAAVDSVQSTLRDVRAQLAPCATAMAEPPMDHSKMPMGGSPSAKPMTPAKPPAAPMDHSKMPMPTPPAVKPKTPDKAPAAPMNHANMPMDHSKMDMAQSADTTSQAVDPVCGLKVDPASAPRATHQGHAYSFCSEQHRELFQKTPAKYLPKGK